MGYVPQQQMIQQAVETGRDWTPIWVAVIGGMFTFLAAAIGVWAKRRSRK